MKRKEILLEKNKLALAWKKIGIVVIIIFALVFFGLIINDNAYSLGAGEAFVMFLAIVGVAVLYVIITFSIKEHLQILHDSRKIQLQTFELLKKINKEKEGK